MRDTDADWDQIGQNEPFYGVMVAEKYLKQNLDETALADFWSTGEGDIRHVLATIRKHFGPFEPGSAIDFGCGVGRLARAMAQECPRVIGVDIAQSMLDVAREHVPGNVELLQSLPDEKVDWINSSMVFQHIPTARGYELYDALMDRLNPGGAFSIHITLYKDEEYLTRVTNRFRYASWDGETMRNVLQHAAPEGTMLMYDYDLTRLMMSATQRQIYKHYSTHANHGGCHGVTLFGRKEG